MSVGAVVPFINDFLVIKGDPALTIGAPVPEGRTKVVVLEFWATYVSMELSCAFLARIALLL